MAVLTPESLKVILELLPKPSRLEAVRMAVGGFTVLHMATCGPESLKVIIESLPESSRLEAVMMTNSIGKTVFDMVARDPECLKILLELVPQAADTRQKTNSTSPPHDIKGSLKKIKDPQEKTDSSHHGPAKI
jgi:hypothetical protein